MFIEDLIEAAKWLEENEGYVDIENYITGEQPIDPLSEDWERLVNASQWYNGWARDYEYNPVFFWNWEDEWGQEPKKYYEPIRHRIWSVIQTFLTPIEFEIVKKIILHNWTYRQLFNSPLINKKNEASARQTVYIIFKKIRKEMTKLGFIVPEAQGLPSFRLHGQQQIKHFVGVNGNKKTGDQIYRTAKRELKKYV